MYFGISILILFSKYSNLFISKILKLDKIFSLIAIESNILKFYDAEFSTTRTCVMMSWALLEVGALKMV